jgi:hypothetical protein
MMTAIVREKWCHPKDNATINHSRERDREQQSTAEDRDDRGGEWQNDNNKSNSNYYNNNNYFNNHYYSDDVGYDYVE